MPASRKYLRPEAIARVARLDLRARYVVEGFLSGQHRSPYLGQSVEFALHRAYTPGDDWRRIDWKAWAKQDRYYVKQYEEESNLRCELVVDVSRSMHYGRGPLNKYDYAATVAASLAYLLLRRQDVVGCMAFDERPRTVVAPRHQQHQLDSILQALEASQPRDKTDLAGVLRDVAQRWPKRGLIVLISDLLAPREGLAKGLNLLHQQGHDIVVLHVMDDDELDFPFVGTTRFEGLELPDHLTCNPRALRAGYLESLGRFLHEVKLCCARHDADYALLRTGQPLDAALSTFLHRRAALVERH